MFLHTGAALAVPLIGGALAGRQLPAPEDGCGTCGDDPVTAEALRQFRAGVRAQKAGKGEGARQAAAALRVIVANGKARNLDEEFRRALQREASIYGHDNILTRGVDAKTFDGHAREFGFTPADLRSLDLPASAPVDLDRGRRILDRLLADGITPFLEYAAHAFDAVGGALDARSSFRRVQTKEQQQAYCQGLKDWMSTAEVLMVLGCLLGPVSCAYWTGVYLGARAHYYWYADCE
jgi:hypothetical protein